MKDIDYRSRPPIFLALPSSKASTSTLARERIIIPGDAAKPSTLILQSGESIHFKDDQSRVRDLMDELSLQV
jgi:hypothetical protein